MRSNIANVSVSKLFGEIKIAIREAILDNILENNFEDGFDFMLKIAAELNLSPVKTKEEIFDFMTVNK